ncbi:hydrolase-like protein family isoform X3 [Tasmannia lanceolata]|uniref:hydrolase-like protein family isoform X3 n=1 Tax=Tasmannia lanceolata TaxID=3420 RepID=UPI0040630729
MASAPLIHASYHNSVAFWLRNGGHVSSSLSSSSSSSSCSSFDRQAGFGSNLCNISGVNSSWKNTSFKAQSMNTAQGNVVAPKVISKFKHEPDHLLVLVHGIFASPSDWTYVEAELKRRLGSNFLIYEISASSSKVGAIAGLEPISFVTLATPHLGVRGNKQLPFLLGVPILEKLAAPIAPFLIGRTGRQLFHTDGKPSKPPVLLRMASDCEDGKFISALRAFRCRILYANVSYDHMVGWRTSSIRRETELVKPPRRSLDGYKHVVDVEYCPPISSEGPHFRPEAAKAKEVAQTTPNTQNTTEYHDIIEVLSEEMIHGLQRLGWKKVDVSFHSAFWPFFAHNNIHVKSEWLHNAGAGVVAHVADSLKQQESCSFITASL